MIYRTVNVFASRLVEISRLVISWTFVYHVVLYVAVDRNTGILPASYDWSAI